MAVKIAFQTAGEAVKNLSKYLIGIIVVIVLLPLGIIIFLPFIVYRRLIFHCGRVFRSDLGKMVSSRGSIFLTEDVNKSARFKLVVGAVIQGGSSTSISTAKQNALTTLSSIDDKTGELLYPELQQKIVKWMGYRFWKPLENFQIEDCVTSLSDSVPLTEEEVHQYMKSESLIPYPHESALWKVTMVPNFTPNTSSHYYKEGEKYSFIIITLHHAICDGFSVLKFVYKMFNIEDKKLSNKLSPPETKSLLQKIKNAIFLTSRVPYDIGDLIASQSYESNVWEKSSIPLSSVKILSKKSPLIESLLPQPLQHELEYIHYFSDLVLFSDIRKISKFHNVSTFAVILAALSGAIRSVMFESSKSIPNAINLAIPLPVPGHPDKLRNHLCGISLPLPVGESDPIKQLHKINFLVQNLKKSTTPALSNLSISVYSSLPPAILYPIMKLSHLAHFIGLSSFPGPKEELSIEGIATKEVYWMTSGIAGCNSLTFGFTTYAGYGRLTLEADQSIVGSEATARDVVNAFSEHLNVLRASDRNSENSAAT